MSLRVARAPFVGSVCVAALAATAATLAAQPAPHISGAAALRARATISGDSAMAIARGRVPHGRIRSGELEEEKGRLIYSFDMKVPGKAGIDEVDVDARTGAVVGVEHESAADEKREAAENAKLAKSAKPKP